MLWNIITFELSKDYEKNFLIWKNSFFENGLNNCYKYICRIVAFVYIQKYL